MLLTSIGKFLALCFQLLPLLYSLYILSGPQITCTLIFVLNFLVTLSLKLFLYFQCLHAALWGVIAIVSNVLCKPSSKYLSLEIICSYHIWSLWMLTSPACCFWSLLFIDSRFLWFLIFIEIHILWMCYVKILRAYTEYGYIDRWLVFA